MKRDTRAALIAKLRFTLQELAGDRGAIVRYHGNTDDRLLIEINRRAYMVLVPNTAVALTVGNIRQRVRKWPSLGGAVAFGHVILAPNASLSMELSEYDNASLPESTVVVGRWGSRNELAVNGMSSDLALILQAAGVPFRTIVTSSSRDAPMPTSSSVQGSIPLPSQRSLRSGMRIDCYRLDRRLGRGHSAEVWKAEVVAQIPGADLQEGTVVALKLYFPSLLQGFQALRIQREFAVAAGLTHPNFARVYDLLLSPSRPFHAFMAMEYIEGPTLKDVISRTGKLNPGQTVSLASQMFGALAEIHSEDALHRDVKAANIMVASHDEASLSIKLVDLGIVSIPSEDKFTAASVFLGSKHSAPLEQLVGGEVDERTDIYGAGSVLFHCLTGAPMYSNVGPEGAIVQRMMASPEVLSSSLEVGPLESRLVEFVNQCIAVNPSNRPGSAMECVRFLGELQAYFPR